MRTILLVDDNEDNRTVYRTLLEHAGYRVLESADGTSALECVQTELPELVVMDLAMPGLDGWEVTRILKSDPSTSDIPVLALTARAMPDNVARAQKAGFERCLMMPIDPSQVLEEVKRVLGDAQPSGSSPAGEPTGRRSRQGAAADEESSAPRDEPPFHAMGEQSTAPSPPVSLGAHAAPVSLSLA